MYQKIAFSLMFLVALTINAQTVNIQGKITDTDGEAISNAIVELLSLGLKDTTGSNGSYSISQTTGIESPPLMPKTPGISFQRGVLEIHLATSAAMKVEIFDVAANILRREYRQVASPGTYRLNIAENASSINLLIIRTTIGTDEFTFRYIPLQIGKFAANPYFGSSAPINGKLAKSAAVNDTLEVSADGYQTKTVDISSYEMELDIMLEAEASANQSAGCGSSTSLTGETDHSINSRDYILRVPDDYDENKAYRLVVANHPMGGTARAVANDGYFKLWDLADGSTIFAAPQGIGNAWRNSDESDVKFIRSMVTEIEDELCIDQSRIFACGFSMGGSMSYALACGMSDKIRAVAAYSGGPMSGCNRSGRNPVAYLMIHGTNDNICTYPGYGVPQLEDIADVNGCQAMDVPGTLKPSDQSGMNPACGDYEGCMEGYPARACVFVGGHSPSPGGRNTWVPEETWDFFTQF